MSTLDELRLQQNLEFLRSGMDFSFGNEDDCPLSLNELATIDTRDARIEEVLVGGATATVYKITVEDREYALKRASGQFGARTLFGEIPFLNELQRHAELRLLWESGIRMSGIVAATYGSLHHGFIVCPWIEGKLVTRWDERCIRQVLEMGASLVEHGFFCWSFCPGNLLDDGKSVWILDLEHMYRFDPLTQINSAGNGLNCPQFHLAERIESRNLFAHLLDVERTQGEAAALGLFRTYKEIAVEIYALLRDRLAKKGALAAVLTFYDQMIAEWRGALNEGLEELYLRDARRTHRADLTDDLIGKTCTSRTLLRARWLVERTPDLHLKELVASRCCERDAQELTKYCSVQRRTSNRSLASARTLY
jgi:hypothetical protein